MSMTVLPLVGPEAQNAMAAFYKLLIGLHMLPEYNHMGYQEFFASMEGKPEEELRGLIQMAIRCIPMDQDEIFAFLKFATDKNGIAYSRANISKLELKDIYDICTEVAMEIGRIKITILTEEEKKKYRTCQLT